LEAANSAQSITTAIREIRQKNNVKPRDMVKVSVLTEDFSKYESFIGTIQKLAGVDELVATQEERSDLQSFVHKGDKFYVDVGIVIDLDAERSRLQEERKYTEGFIKSVEKKLSNQGFVSNAPAVVVENERKKLEDGQVKLKLLEESLAKLN